MAGTGPAPRVHEAARDWARNTFPPPPPAIRGSDETAPLWHLSVRCRSSLRVRRRWRGRQHAVNVQRHVLDHWQDPVLREPCADLPGKRQRLPHLERPSSVSYRTGVRRCQQHLRCGVQRRLLVAGRDAVLRATGPDVHCGRERLPGLVCGCSLSYKPELQRIAEQVHRPPRRLGVGSKPGERRQQGGWRLSDRDQQPAGYQRPVRVRVQRPNVDGRQTAAWDLHGKRACVRSPRCARGQRQYRERVLAVSHRQRTVLTQTG